MATDTIIEVHLNGTWRPAAELQAYGHDRCRFEYLPEYLFADDAQRLAFDVPLGFQPEVPDEAGGLARDIPPFLYDLVPQGKGRGFLVKLLKLADDDRLVMPLLMAGAFNPIGRLRLASAVEFFNIQAASQPQAHQVNGLTLQDIRHRSEQFLDHVSLYSMLAAGTTGVQGVAPKFLLTQDRQGRWHADMALADDQAATHWLMKLPRGKTQEDRAVLRNEAAYLRLAARCGLRAPSGDSGIEDGVMLVDEMLFVRRFDRQVIDGRLHRLHQESMASVAGLRGFAAHASLNQLLAALRRNATHAARETTEFIKRDVMGRAMRDTDNHARNTAMQILPDGTAQLTPVFDFAPMFKDPEVVVRSLEWKDARGTTLRDWQPTLDALLTGGILNAAEHAAIVAELIEFSHVVGNLATLASECGVERDILDQCLRSIDEQASQLARLRA